MSPAAARVRASSQVASRKDAEAVVVAHRRRLRGLRRVVAADERYLEAFGRSHVIVAEPAFDAEPVLVRVAVAAVDLHDAVTLDGHGRLAADAAERTERVDDLVELLHGALRRRLVHQRLLVQRARRACLHALAAGHAGRHPHGVVNVEDGHGVTAAQAHADDVVDLHLAARAHAGAARDARVEIHGDRRIREVEPRLVMAAAELRAVAVAALDTHRLGPFPEWGLIVGTLLARAHVAREQLEHQLARLRGPLGLRRDLHTGGRLANARRRQHALALDLDHACAAIAVDAVARHVDVAKMRNSGAFPLGDVPKGLARARGNFFAVELEYDRVAHFTESFRNSVSKWATGFGAA